MTADGPGWFDGLRPTPSEGVVETCDMSTPSEGVNGHDIGKTSPQSLTSPCGNSTPSEGVVETCDVSTPSEGVYYDESQSVSPNSVYTLIP